MNRLIIFCFIYIVCHLATQAQTPPLPDTNQIKQNPFFQIQTTPKFMSLSIISPTLYNHWSTQLKFFEEKYKNQNMLLLISATTSKQKTEFLTEFTAQQSTDKDLLVAYADALKVVTLKYQVLDFKHHLYLKK
ncbi:hypothetical protein [uncultured Microscilla sp.]|uniref:hypothetical protein n=1 Tax=uncultured Microscilla sp. TaxID=432653 RepID=UPI002615645B|nr:hypothetical protein [uncultured Microscilla sp.]